MSFIFYDIIFLIFFVLFVAGFLYSRRKNLKKDGLLFLYRTSFGIRIIENIGNKYQKTLKVLSYISIITGYALMVSMFYLLGRVIYVYITFPEIVREIKVPPITPLIPYLPQIFKLDFLPPFYFTYWIVIIAVIAITHEFAHGIFAAYDKIRIKSTGFGFFPFFLPIFLAAFVELDEEKMAKKKVSSQLAILSAGTFANVITAVFFFLVLLAFFYFAFSPAGVIYDTYPYAFAGVSTITSVNGISLTNPSYEQVLNLMNENGFNKVEVKNANYVITRDSFEEQKENQDILLYYDAPAINSNLGSIILSVNGEKVTSIESVEKEISKYSPGEKITLKILDENNSASDVEIFLGSHPEKEDQSWLGIGFLSQKSSGLLGKIYSIVSSFKKPHIYYESHIGEFSLFVYNLLWWLILISISVALVNMLPVGIFDGGRFFYLTAFLITRNEKISRKLFAISTYLILFLVFALMLFWAFSFI